LSRNKDRPLIVDARELPEGHQLETDVCIVGAGVAGITLAHALQDTALRVLLVEAGGKGPDKAAQGLFWGRNTGHHYYGLDTSRCSGVGGSSHKWLLELPDMTLGARIHPLEPIDFEVRPWVPNSGWPFGYDELEPYYRSAHRFCTDGNYGYRGGDWAKHHQARQLHLAGEHITSTVFQFTSRDTFIGQAWAALEASATVTLMTHAIGHAIDTNSAGNQADCLHLSSSQGQKLRIKAHRFVLAAGALETVRLLLLSDRQLKCGLGNQHDLVGRYFMEHPHVWTGRYIPAAHIDATQLGFYYPHRVDGTTILGKLITTPKAQREGGLLNHCISLHPRAKQHGANLVPEWPIDNWPLLNSFAYHRGWDADINVAAAGSDIPDASDSPALPWNLRKGLKSIRSYGRHCLQRLAWDFGLPKRSQPIVFTLNHMSEQVPNPDSRVRLGRERDGFGRRRIELDWRLTDLDIDSMIRSQQLMDTALRQADLGRLALDDDPDRLNRLIHGGWHHMGTTRMHVDPRRGVVDPNCQVHGTDNLFIAGPSVFPTSGYANPVLTILALTLRLADHLKAKPTSFPNLAPPWRTRSEKGSP
jgi:choline dehydrogenase-like flavoprotein